ncbi:hypothetical protein AB0C81_26425 [Streptomyces roseoverticillatus]|uniref:hypothetical protein n=1 Tax=Streptomyces roseoverticillatus TaxID=66429 RepID=UPI0033FB37D2
MAVAHPTAAPMAAPGYGKRSAPDQAPRSRDDFAHLPTREAYIAAHIDRLPDGAAVDIKTLAKELPAYGQQAVASALKALTDAGHLRRIRRVTGEGRTQWVSRWFFSRTPRDNAWWDAFLHSTEGPPAAPAASTLPAGEPAPARPKPCPTASAAPAAASNRPRTGPTPPTSTPTSPASAPSPAAAAVLPRRERCADGAKSAKVHRAAFRLVPPYRP